MTTNIFYNVDGNPPAQTRGTSASIRNEFLMIQAGFASLPISAYAADTGAANAYVVSVNPNITAYTDGLQVVFKASHANTAASTLNVNGLGATNILHADGTPLQIGDILVGQFVAATYNITTGQFSLVTAAMGEILATITSQAAASQATLTAQINAAAFQAALPAQAGNAGKFVTTNGTTASWASCGLAGGSPMITANITLTSASAGYQFIQMASLGESVTLPDATTISVGSPKFYMDNSNGGYPCGIRDNTGTLIMAIAAGGTAYVSCENISTRAGVWSVTGTNLEPGLITLDNTFSSTYNNTMLPQYCALDSNTSIHFLSTNSGFSAFILDNSGNVLTTPVAVSATAFDVPCQCFMVSSTTVIVFYGQNGVTTQKAVVLTISGSSPSYTLAVGTPQTLTTAAQNPWGGENSIDCPNIAQLTPTLYLCAYSNSSPVTAAVAISVSGSAVTIGSPVNIITTNSVVGSTTAYALNSTQALILYKSGSATPFTNYSVVISISGTVCTINSPVAGMVGSLGVPPASTLLSPTKFVILDDGNATSIYAQAFSISGTSITAGTAVALVTGLSSKGTAYYSSYYCNRNSNFLWNTATGSTNYFAFNYAVALSGGIVLFSETSNTVSFISNTPIGIFNNGPGVSQQLTFLPKSQTEMLALEINSYYNTSTIFSPANIVLQPFNLSGTTVSQGHITEMQGGDPVYASAIQSPQYVTKLSQGDYCFIKQNNIAQNFLLRGINVVRNNGTFANYRGTIKTPEIYPYAGTYALQKVSANRLVSICCSVQVGGVAQTVRLINMEIAA